jgi:phosphatidate cytidylyltransferase
MALDAQSRENLALRVGSAVVLFPIAVWFTWLGGAWFAVLAGLAAAVMAAELIRMFGGYGVAGYFGVLVAGAFPVATLLAAPGEILPAWAWLALAGATVALLALFLFRRVPPEEIPRGVAVVMFSWLYCGLLIAPAVSLRLQFGRSGFGWVVLAYVVTWGNDTLAYFAGQLFGRHKLLPRISPKKTWEGFAGGIAGSLAGGAAVWWLLLRGEASLGVVLVVGAGAAVLGPLGDLAESLVKRAAGVKDSSRIIPGHGGLLDRVDALLFVAPWVYLCATYLR